MAEPTEKKNQFRSGDVKKEQRNVTKPSFKIYLLMPDLELVLWKEKNCRVHQLEEKLDKFKQKVQKKKKRKKIQIYDI